MDAALVSEAKSSAVHVSFLRMRSSRLRLIIAKLELRVDLEDLIIDFLDCAFPLSQKIGGLARHRPWLT